MPLKLGEKVIGAISIQSDHPYAWDDIGLDAFRALAGLAAVAIRNAQLFKETSDDLSRQKALYTAGTALISAQEPSEVLQVVVEEGCEAVGGWRACSTLVSESGIPTYLTSVGFEPDLEVATSIRRDGLSVKVVSSGEPFFNSDTLAAKNHVHPNMIEQGVKAAACLPLECRGKMIGVLWIHYRTPRRFSDSERMALLRYANQAAIAYDNARKRAEILQTLSEAGRAATSSYDLREMLNELVEQATLLTGYEGQHASLAYIVLAEGATITPVAAYPRQELSRIGLAVGEQIDLRTGKDGRIGIVGRAIKTGESQLVPDVELDPDYLPSCGDTCSELAVPIRIGDEVIGAINVEHPRIGTFDYQDQLALECLAAQAGVAIQGVRHFEEMQKIKGYIGSATALDWIKMVSTT